MSSLINSFAEIRRDGKVIPESMTVDQMSSLGWGPSRVAKVKWEYEGHLVELHAEHGLLAKVLPDRHGVACIKYQDEHAQRCSLAVFNPDGSERFVLSSTQVIGAAVESGSYCWFEPPRAHLSDSFGVVFRLYGTQRLFQLDFNSASGALVGVYAMQ